ncbi:hypothetical protein BJF78_04105 [Pseudonocardia sp. CNS-139]|nr:hypothetical protein BJF78_04105 [Pseudonocardia sp. CNS-139]
MRTTSSPTSPSGTSWSCSSTIRHSTPGRARPQLPGGPSDQPLTIGQLTSVMLNAVVSRTPKRAANPSRSRGNGATNTLRSGLSASPGPGGTDSR